MQERDERFMARALELARRPAFTYPNPRVGAVLVKDHEIVGEGAHEGAGTPHAEAVALAGVDARGGTLYVTLEPCCHQGRTPPCVPAILEARIERVVVAVGDPDEQVAGRGLAELIAAGVDVEVGVLASEAELLNAPYLHHRRTGTSFVSLKLASSLDGALAAADGSSQWISGPRARSRVHERRHEVDAVMVGAGTVLSDDPLLTVREITTTRQPTRIVVDATGRVPTSARIFGGEAPTIVATTDRAGEAATEAWVKCGAEVIALPPSDGGIDLHALMKELGTRDLVEIMCEGGAELATSLLDARLVQRLELHYGPLLLGSGAVRVGDLGIGTMEDAERWTTLEVRAVDDGFIATLVPTREEL